MFKKQTNTRSVLGQLTMSGMRQWLEQAATLPSVVDQQGTGPGVWIERPGP